MNSEWDTPKNYLSIDLGKKLSDIPESLHCYECGGLQQKEWFNYMFYTNQTDVSVSIPAYGCVSCPVKIMHSGIMDLLYKRISEGLYFTGDMEGHKHFKEQTQRNVKSLDLNVTEPLRNRGVIMHKFEGILNSN